MTCLSSCPTLIADMNDPDARNTSNEMKEFNKRQFSWAFTSSVVLNWFCFRSALQIITSEKFMLVTMPIGSVVCQLKRDATDTACFTEVLAKQSPTTYPAVTFLYNLIDSSTKLAGPDDLRLKII